jgi:hypothetical protein
LTISRDASRPRAPFSRATGTGIPKLSRLEYWYASASRANDPAAGPADAELLLPAGPSFTAAAMAAVMTTSAQTATRANVFLRMLSPVSEVEAISTLGA